MNDKSTTIITADYMYLVFVGSEDLIIKIINKLNQNQAHKNTLFISHNIDIPCVDLLDNDTLKNIFRNNGIIKIIKQDAVFLCVCFL